MTLNQENRNLRNQNKQLSDRLDRLESYSRRHNLIFFNVEENSLDPEMKVRRILQSMGIADANDVVFDDLHRLGPLIRNKTRPIIFRLVRLSDRNRIWEARRKLKTTKYIISEDFPESYQKQRSFLKPVLSLAKSKGLKATLIANKILIESKSYSVDQIKDLPPDLNPEKECIIQDSNTVCFFGRHTPLSNFYKSHFVLNGHHYNCAEQFLQCRKTEVM